VRLIEYADVPGMTICPLLFYAQELTAKRFKKLKPSVNAPGVGPNSALSFISPLFLSFDINSFYLAADFKRITSYTEELIQNAHDRPSETRAILEPCLAPLSASLADLENELRGAEYRFEGLLSKRSSLLSKLVEVQTLLGQSDH